jgi:hypothetical protein
MINTDQNSFTKEYVVYKTVKIISEKNLYGLFRYNNTISIVEELGGRSGSEFSKREIFQVTISKGVLGFNPIFPVEI